MMSEGFITTATVEPEPEEELIDSRLFIEDQRLGVTNDDDTAMTIFVEQTELKLMFNLPEARAFAEALTEIINRYDKPQK